MLQGLQEGFGNTVAPERHDYVILSEVAFPLFTCDGCSKRLQ